MRTSRQGFTLLELIVVAVIVALLLGAVAPNLSQARDSAALRAGVRAVISCFRMARDAAVNRQREVWVEFILEGSVVHGQWRPTPGSDSVESPTKSRPTGHERPLPSGVFATVGDPGETQRVAFRPDGSSDAAVVTLTNRRSRRLYVVVSGVTGHAKVSARPDSLSELQLVEGP